MLASIEAFLHSSCNGGNNGNSVTRYPIFGSNNENMPTNDGQRGLLIDRNIARLKERVIGRGCSAKLCRSARCLGPLMELELALAYFKLSGRENIHIRQQYKTQCWSWDGDRWGRMRLMSCMRPCIAALQIGKRNNR